jgi:gamma-glutamylcysteine synthetase
MWEIARTGKTLADRWLDLFNGEWGGRIDPIYEAARF